MNGILGNDALLSSLQRMAEAGRIPHGVILEGKKGCGKKMIARAIAEMLKAGPADIIMVTHEKPNLISVDDVREQINHTVHIRPYDSRYKIYIVDEAEKMNVQAQNALLKTVEEPPGYVVIILLTENRGNFLDTILSRCVLFTVRPLPEETIEKALSGRGIPEEKARMAAKLSGGSLGRAEALSRSEEFYQLLEIVTATLENADRMDTKQLLQRVSDLQKFKGDLGEALDYIRQWFLDVLLYKSKADPELLSFTEKKSVIRRQSEAASWSALNGILEEITASEERLKANVNPELTTELLLMTIRSAFDERK